MREQSVLRQTHSAINEPRASSSAAARFDRRASMESSPFIKATYLAVRPLSIEEKRVTTHQTHSPCRRGTRRLSSSGSLSCVDRSLFRVSSLAPSAADESSTARRLHAAIAKKNARTVLLPVVKLRYKELSRERNARGARIASRIATNNKAIHDNA